MNNQPVLAERPAVGVVREEDGFCEKPLYEIGKRLFDFFASLTALILFSPVFLVIAIVISVSDGEGKPFFIQERCGKNGKHFKVFKFRTMVVDAEKLKASLQAQNEMDGPAFKIQDDPRITKAGKFLRATNLDELPQLLNILKGEMSFVGPRPPLPDEVAQYSERDKKRLLVMPGLTCYWQVSLNRNDISFERWMELDRKYLAERSAWVDLKLILRTMYVVFRHHDGR